MQTATTLRLVTGATVTPFSLETLAHGSVHVPSPGLTHLQFRRFAGCPICSLHLRDFAKRNAELVAANITTVAFFHSSAESLRRYHIDLPFPVVADPQRHYYQYFGIERSLRSVLHPRAVVAAMAGALRAPSNPLDSEGGRLGLPGEFLVNAHGVAVAVHYGKHADDAWSVDDVLALAGNPSTR